VTLISAVLTSDYAVLASDRRVAWLPPARPPDDHRNKMILLCGHFVMGYSGLGEVAGRRVDEWVALQLAAVDPTCVFAGLARAATRDFAPPFSRLKDRDRRRHSFLSVG